VRLHYDVSQLEGIKGGWIGNILDDLGREDEWGSNADDVVEESLSRIKEVEVAVGSEERRLLVLRGLKGSFLLERTKVIVRARV